MKTRFTFLTGKLVSAIFILLAFSSFSQLVTNTTTLETFATIQAAIDDPDTQDGDELAVSAGDYFENILMNKSLTLTGPKAGVDGNDPARGTGEATIYPPAIWYGDGTYNGGYLMRITVDDVIVDGLTFDGDNPSLAGDFSANTGAFDLDFGIMSYWSVWYDATDLIGDNLIIQNNVLKNFKLSALVMWAGFEGATASSSILHNKIQNSASNPAINLGMNYYVQIEFNTIIDCNMGVLISWYWDSKPAGSPGGVIQNNSMNLRTIVTNWGDTYSNVQGIQYHFIYAFADAWNISDNTFTNDSAGGQGSSGIVINIDATEDPLIVENNDISGFENGYRLSTNYFETTVSGGSLTNNKYGVTVSNYNFNGNYPADHSDFTIRNMNIQNSMTAGVFLDDNETSLSHAPVNASIYNCFINGGPNGILLSGDPAFANDVHDNDLSGNNEFAINNLSPNGVNATCNWYGHWSGPEAESNPNGTGSAVTANVTIDPWVTDGEDISIDAGFQPVAGSCVPVLCGQNNSKYLICHKGTKTLCVGMEEVEEHLAHGDSFGECTLKSFEESREFEAELYPNPSENFFNLSLESSNSDLFIITVYDINGKLIDHFKAEQGQPVYIGENLGPGVYCMSIQQGTETRIINFIKQ